MTAGPGGHSIQPTIVLRKVSFNEDQVSLHLTGLHSGEMLYVPLYSHLPVSLAEARYHRSAAAGNGKMNIAAGALTFWHLMSKGDSFATPTRV